MRKYSVLTATATAKTSVSRTSGSQRRTANAGRSATMPRTSQSVIASVASAAGIEVASSSTTPPPVSTTTTIRPTPTTLRARSTSAAQPKRRRLCSTVA
jgi:hypothetical protein